MFCMRSAFWGWVEQFNKRMFFKILCNLITKNEIKLKIQILSTCSHPQVCIVLKTTCALLL